MTYLMFIKMYTFHNSSLTKNNFLKLGNGSCNYGNGKARLILTPSGGLELDLNGVRKKKWQWMEIHNNHAHAPPFQSIQYVLNNQLSVRLVSQEKINVDFVAESQICKFRINIKPKNSVNFSWVKQGVGEKNPVYRPGRREGEKRSKKICRQIRKIFFSFG